MTPDSGVRDALRFVAAALAMSGRLAAGEDPGGELGMTILVEKSVACADALLEELRKEPEL